MNTITIQLPDDIFTAVTEFKNNVVSNPTDTIEEAAFFRSCFLTGLRAIEKNLIDMTATEIRRNPALVIKMAEEAGVDPTQIDLNAFGIQETLEMGEFGPILVNRQLVQPD